METTMSSETKLFLRKTEELSRLVSAMKGLEIRSESELLEIEKKLADLSIAVNKDRCLNAGGKFEWVDSVLVKVSIASFFFFFSFDLKKKEKKKKRPLLLQGVEKLYSSEISNRNNFLFHSCILFTTFIYCYLVTVFRNGVYRKNKSIFCCFSRRSILAKPKI